MPYLEGIQGVQIGSRATALTLSLSFESKHVVSSCSASFDDWLGVPQGSFSAAMMVLALGRDVFRRSLIGAYWVVPSTNLQKRLVLPSAVIS